MSIRIFQGDCRQVMATLPVCSVDAIVTDPPYELGFMGKGWDSTGVANDPETWRQALRVLKPGGYLLAFSGTRTYHRMAVAIEDAGFEIRDQIGWLYGSGFPKSHNGEWGGTALKPAWEPVCMARKPLQGTVAANFAAHGTGGLNIDGCRVGTTKDVPTSPAKDRIGQVAKGNERGRTAETTGFDAETGRWPANLIHDGSDEVLAGFPKSDSPWIGNPNSGAKGGLMFGGSSQSVDEKPEYRDSGSAARFFYCAKADRADRNEGLHGMPTKQQDPSREPGRPGGENPRNRGAAERENHHPTVKPTDLMRYLCRLVTPPGGVVLDPFMGSGSTLKAAELEGFSAIGIELSADYIAIAQRRIGADAPLFASVEVA